MLPNRRLLDSIIECLSVRTGFPEFLIDGTRNIVLTSKDFSPELYSFADLDMLQSYLETKDKIAALHPISYYTFFTGNRFLYNFLPVLANDRR